jgi:hypothetical protein
MSPNGENEAIESVNYFREDGFCVVGWSSRTDLK